MIGMEKFVFGDVEVHKNIYYSWFFKKYEKIGINNSFTNFQIHIHSII